MLLANCIAHPAHDKSIRQLEHSLLVQFAQVDHAPLRPLMLARNDQREVIVAEPFVTQPR